MTAKRSITVVLTLMVIAAVMAPSLMAQSLVTGDITGTVTDPSGAVVSGATVTLKSDANGSTRNSTTGSNGTYRFPLLSPGSYTVTVTASGFSKAQSTAQVNVGQASIADIKMAVGSSSQTVEVTGAAPLVNAENADLSTNFDQNMIANSAQRRQRHHLRCANRAWRNHEYRHGIRQLPDFRSSGYFQRVHGQRRERHGSVPELEQLWRHQPDSRQE